LPEPGPNRRSGPEDKPPTGRGPWHGGALLLIALCGIVVFRGWFIEDRIPPGDFAGYAAVAEYVFDSVVEHGAPPRWSSKYFAGATRFISSAKEYLILPLVAAFEPITALQIAHLLLRIAAAWLFYFLFVRELGAPLAGGLAGCCYAFGPAASHLTRHLDASVSAVLFPLVALIAIDAGRNRRYSRWLLLGAVLGVQFCINYVQAMVAWSFACVIAALAGLGARDGSRTALPIWLAGFATTLAGFVAVAASQIAWFAADLGNHAAPLSIALPKNRATLSLASPLVVANRLNALVDWLPRGFRLFPYDDPLGGQANYLGVVPLLAIAAGWNASRRDRALTTWLAAAVLLAFALLAMALGPHHAIGQLGQGFAWSPATTRWVRVFAIAASIAAGITGVVRVRRDHRSGTAIALIAIAVVLAFSTFSLFDAVARLATPLDKLRSPGHFFDMAPFAFYAAFGLALVAIDRAIGPRFRWWWILAIALTAADFWPVPQLHFRGEPRAPLREFRSTLADLPADPGLRILLDHGPSRLRQPPSIEQLSLAGNATGLDLSTNWLPWQANWQWRIFGNAASGELLYPGDASPLRAAGRFGYALLSPDTPPANPAWERIAGNQRFALWRGPEVVPMAYAVRDFAVAVRRPRPGADRGIARVRLAASALAALRAGFTRNLAVVHLIDDSSDDQRRMLEQAVLITGGASFTEPDLAAKTVAAVRRRASEKAIREALANRPRGERIDAEYQRISPTRMTVEVDAGDRPALLVVSESYHPWWTATVDGDPGRIFPAQVAFMGITVAPGPHRVELRFDPPGWVRLADWVSAVAWIALACALVGSAFAKWRTRAEPRSD